MKASTEFDFRRILSPRCRFDWFVGRLWERRHGQLLSPATHPALAAALSNRPLIVQWPQRYGWHAFPWLDPIRSGLERYVSVRRINIPQLPIAAASILLIHRDEVHKVVVDYNDSPDSICTEYLQNCLLYFKMQYRPSGYGDVRIVPGRYPPSGGVEMYRYVPALRHLRDSGAPAAVDVYGRFGLRNDIRRRAVDLLGAQQYFKYRGGGKLLSLTRSLAEAARSKVCLDLPGDGPLCHRLVDYLSIGSCIVAYPHEATLHPPLVLGKHVVYCRADLSDLVDICRHYLAHDEERETMVQDTRSYFDAYLHKDCVAAYYLEYILARLPR